MSRQRMYLFERAYADYGTHLRQFSRRLLSGCGSIWKWFWDGPGAAAIEVILRVLVVGTAIGAAWLYMRYEREHGRGFSISTLGVLAIIVAVVGVLLWGWKAPVHFVARLLSGASAAGLVLALSLLAIALAVVVFSGYLVSLFTLTGLSFIVFVPMRGAHSLWLLYRRIAYRCPYDDCTYSGLPIHVCKCGARYDDLQPSFYGILHQTCRHSDGTQGKLPTMDFLGRKNIDRLCGRCQRPLVHSSLGELPEFPIAIVGGVSTGKTVFLLQATRKLHEYLSALPNSTVHIDSESQEYDYRQKIEMLDRGQVIGKTAGGAVHAFGLAVRVSKRLRCLLYLFDKPGEDFATVQRFGRMQVVEHVKGIILLVDPFSLPALSHYAPQMGDGLKASEERFDRIVHNLINSVNLMILKRPDDPCDVPVAVVLSKADALPTDDLSFLSRLCPNNGGPPDEALSHRCREALTKLGAGPSIRDLEMKFTKVSYFACSALGRLPELRNTSAFQPKGVAAPLLWLLGITEVSQAGTKAAAA